MHCSAVIQLYFVQETIVHVNAHSSKLQSIYTFYGNVLNNLFYKKYNKQNKDKNVRLFKENSIFLTIFPRLNAMKIDKMENL